MHCRGGFHIRPIPYPPDSIFPQTGQEQHHIEMVKQNILPPFDKRIWQRNYWEHIIRNEKEHQQIIQYIIDNPKKWALDKLNNHSNVL